jgi:nitrite reductase (NADH) small subunit
MDWARYIAEILPPSGRQNDGGVYRYFGSSDLKTDLDREKADPLRPAQGRLSTSRCAQDDSHWRWLSKGELVGGFERRSADAADDGGAIAADEGIIDFFGAIRTPQAHIFRRGWIWGLRVVHSEDERSMRKSQHAQDHLIEEAKELMSEFVRICAKSELPPSGDAREIVVGDKILCIANENGAICAMDNVCPHRGGPLGQGMLEGGKLVCPWHAWAFDLRTGAAVHSPHTKVELYEIKIDGDDVLARI